MNYYFLKEQDLVALRIKTAKENTRNR